MIKAYIVDSFHHPETGHVLLVKLTSQPCTLRSIGRATARGDWGEIEFRRDRMALAGPTELSLGRRSDNHRHSGLDPLRGAVSLL